MKAKKDVAANSAVAAKVAAKGTGMRQHVKMAMDVDGIIERIKETHDLKTDKQAAEMLLMSQSQLNNAKTAGRIPLDLIGVYCSKHNVSFEWLMTGEMPELPRALQGIREDSELYEMISTMRKIPVVEWNKVRKILQAMAEDKEADGDEHN